MRTKTQLLKSASTLKEFSNKIKNAQEDTLTPESVKEIAIEIMDIAEVASELAEEIAGGVPAEETSPLGMGENRETEQIEVAQDETDEEKKKRMEKDAQDDTDENKDKLKEQVANLTTQLTGLKREAKLAKLAPKYASLFPKNMHEAKMNEILNSKQPLQIVEAKIQEASDIITNKTMVKIASMNDSIFDFDNGGSDEISIADKL